VTLTELIDKGRRLDSDEWGKRIEMAKEKDSCICLKILG